MKLRVMVILGVWIEQVVESTLPPARRVWSTSRVRIRSLDPETLSGWLAKFNEGFLVERYMYDKIFMKIWLVFTEIWSKVLEISAAVLKNA